MAEIRCHDRALRLLAARPHFRAELGAKLTARGYDAEEVAATLDRLTASGFLADADAARSFVAARQRRQGWGKARLRAELLRRGADGPAVAAALAAVDDEDELAQARDTAARWGRRGSRDRAALARHLDRKGFTRRVILAVLAESAASAGADQSLADGLDDPASAAGDLDGVD